MAYAFSLPHRILIRMIEDQVMPHLSSHYTSASAICNESQKQVEKGLRARRALNVLRKGKKPLTWNYV